MRRPVFAPGDISGGASNFIARKAGDGAVGWRICTSVELVATLSGDGIFFLFVDNIAYYPQNPDRNTHRDPKINN